MSEHGVDPFIHWPSSGALGKCPRCHHWTYDLECEVCCECEPDVAWRILDKDEA